MPNYTETKLTFSLPAARLDEFLAVMEGPADWAYPREALNEYERPKCDLSNHGKLQVHASGESQTRLISDFKAFMAEEGWPAWMKPSKLDLELFVVAPETLKAPRVPFSVAKLHPWKSEAEFVALFPDASPDKPLWSKDADASQSSSSIRDLRHGRIGVKWPPHPITLETSIEAERATVKIRYTTPWSPIADVFGLLGALCRAHQAKFLLTWVEEQHFCGYSYFNPDRDEPMQEQEYDADCKWSIERADEDDPTSTYCDFDHKEFERDISEIVDDPDF